MTLYRIGAPKQKRDQETVGSGASMEVFRRVLTFAYRAGANGYLAGRAIWWPAFQHLPDAAAMEKELDGGSAGYVAEINALTEREATPWTRRSERDGSVALANAGHTFPEDYPSMA